MTNKYVIDATVTRIYFKDGRYTTIDTEDLERVSMYNWVADERGYVHCSYWLKGENKWGNWRMHRLLLGATGNEKVDHIDRQPLNNCKSNIRIVTHSENLHNSNITARNTTGFRGVNKIKYKGKLSRPWSAYIRANGKQLHLGYHATREDAAQAYDQAKRIHHPTAPASAYNFPELVDWL